MKKIVFVFFSAFVLFSCSDNQKQETILAQGNAAFEKKEYTQALNLWRQLYKNDPNNISLMLKIGKCYLRLGKVEKAKPYYQKAIEAEPENQATKIQLARIYMLTWELEKAWDICRRLEEASFASCEFDLVRADLHLMTDQPEKALELYQKAVNSDNTSARALMKLALFLKSKGKTDKAMEAFDRAQDLNTEDPDIQLLKADFYLLEDDITQAETVIKKALHKDPENLFLKGHLLKLYLSTRQLDKAQAVVLEMLAQHEDTDLKMTLADIYIMNGRLDEAADLIQQIKDTGVEYTAEFELLQGKYWLFSRRPVFATEHLKNALDLKPGLTHTRYLLGMTHLLNGKIKLAENTLLQTLMIQPNHQEALILLAELLYKKGETALSLKYAEQLVKYFPEDKTGYTLMGLNLLEKKEYQKARKQFVNAFELGDEANLTQYYIGLTEELSGNTSAALKWYRRILDEQPDLIDVTFRYCDLLLRTGKGKTAFVYLDRNLSNTDHSARYYFMAAQIASRVKKPSQAENWLKTAVRIDESYGAAYFVLARHYQSIKKFTDAIKILRQCVRKNPNYMEAWLELSRQYYSQQDLQSALAVLEDGFSKFKESPVYQSNLAWMLLENEKEINRAMNLAQNAFEKLPDNNAVADTLGWAYYHKQIYSQAIWILSDVLEKNPDSGFVQFHLGMSYLGNGNMEKARLHLESAQKASDDSSYRLKLEKALASLNQDEKDPKQTDEPGSRKDLISFPGESTIEEEILKPQWDEKSD